MRTFAFSIVACATLLAGCSSDDSNGSGTGGSSASGGSNGSGGSVNTGGSDTGGSGDTGGSATGGTTGSGGSTDSGGSNGSGGSDSDAAADGGEGVPQEAGATGDGSITNPDPLAPCPRCMRVFDGKTFDGWEASPSTWKIVDGTSMQGTGGTSRAAYTKKDYGSFRLVVTARMNPKNGDHLGVLFWGNHPQDPNKPQIDNAGWIQWMPPGVGMWDYHPPKDRGLVATRLAPAPTNIEIWHTNEVLCNIDTGSVRSAVDGVETTKYTWPHPMERTDPLTRIIPGPVAMMRHGGGTSEYKDIFIEDQPTEDKLYTLK
jgi:3-keto-disaccharide hydrolase